MTSRTGWVDTRSYGGRTGLLIDLASSTLLLNYLLLYHLGTKQIFVFLAL